MLGQIALADARLAVEAVQEGFKGDPHEVPVAFLILGEYQQVMVIVSSRLGAMILILAHVQLAAEDGMNIMPAGSLEKMDCAVDIAVTRHRNGVLSKRRDTRHQALDLAVSIEQPRVLYANGGEQTQPWLGLLSNPKDNFGSEKFAIGR